MRAIGYVRVSTEEQARDGVSLDAQRAKIEGHCRLHEIELIGIEIDAGVSASTLDRPGLKAALAMLTSRQAGGLVIAKLDRLTRSVRDWAVLIETHFGPEKEASKLVSIGDSIDTKTAIGRMMLNLMVTIAQWEREAIAERTRDALAHKRSNGERVGTIPRGFQLCLDGRTLTADPAEVEDIDTIRRLSAEGLGSRAIARTLGASGSRRWSESTIRRILAKGNS